MPKVSRNTILFIVFMVIVASWVFVYKWNKKSNEEFLKTEINNKDFFSLVVKYDYLKGSKQGIDFQNQLKELLIDGVITRGEYQKLTGDKASISIYEKDEEKNLYKDSKNKLIEINGNKKDFWSPFLLFRMIKNTKYIIRKTNIKHLTLTTMLLLLN